MAEVKKLERRSFDEQKTGAVEDREKVIRAIAKTSTDIRKKYNSLKNGKTEMGDLLHKSYKPIVDPLKQIVENTLKNDIEHDA
ncbi:hypothetical protein KPH14_000747 [Odynerus spinipes]|uniref:Uncharacterized protein n=1 Tax=Odynerus spinipes TaxID=1348599 RepID=A0AAD9VKC4_9HYME|nr:hypothetical protein KPH14_000747 [Odynerus spinipes]